jgi:hypothetical protein
LTWFPVVFTFSFTNRELQTQPLLSLRQRFEQLDIKLLVDYNIQTTTHVVSKKRNTAKGLQALINGKFIVTESFLDAVGGVTRQVDDGNGSETCKLEQDFDASWPNAMDHLPPRGGEPFEHPDDIYAPDSGRSDVFDGYTFIFYDQTQYNNLLAPITNAGGKALVETITPGETEVDDFVRYVKSVAGEKGLGSFDDGSEGKGVVLVRYLPAKGDQVQWYTEFLTAVSLRLDHRPTEQNEFLEAILIRDASILRRSLEVEDRPSSSDQIQQPAGRSQQSASDEPPPTTQQATTPRRPRTRGPVKRRFAGFDDGSDIDMDEVPPAPAIHKPSAAEGSLFVSQETNNPLLDEPSNQSSRKRATPPAAEDDLMEGMAPAAARFKRQRIEMGQDFASAAPGPPPPEATQPASKKRAKEIDVLAEAKRHREEQEARARAEREDLENLPDDVDLAEIRRLNIVEEMEVRTPASGSRTREQDIADRRWDPKWNGVKNFKKFRPRGEVVGRQPARVIVTLAEVKNKEFGVGDNYWLEDEAPQKRSSGIRSAVQETPVSRPTASRRSQQADAAGHEAEDSGMADEDSQPPRTMARRATTQATSSSNATQSSTRTSQSQRKRPATQMSSEQASKRARPAPKHIEIDDSDDDSDDELKFRFGKRR